MLVQLRAEVADLEQRAAAAQDAQSSSSSSSSSNPTPESPPQLEDCAVEDKEPEEIKKGDVVQVKQEDEVEQETPKTGGDLQEPAEANKALSPEKDSATVNVKVEPKEEEPEDEEEQGEGEEEEEEEDDYKMHVVIPKVVMAPSFKERMAAVKEKKKKKPKRERGANPYAKTTQTVFMPYVKEEEERDGDYDPDKDLLFIGEFRGHVEGPMEKNVV